GALKGANINYVRDTTIETGGDYGEEGFVYQALAPLPVFDGNHAVVGSWSSTACRAAWAFASRTVRSPTTSVGSSRICSDKQKRPPREERPLTEFPAVSVTRRARRFRRQRCEAI